MPGGVVPGSASEVVVPVDALVLSAVAVDAASASGVAAAATMAIMREVPAPQQLAGLFVPAGISAKAGIPATAIVATRAARVNGLIIISPCMDIKKAPAVSSGNV